MHGMFYSGTEADFARPNVRVTDFRVIPITAEEIEAYKDWQWGIDSEKKTDHPEL